MIIINYLKITNLNLQSKTKEEIQTTLRSYNNPEQITSYQFDFCFRLCWFCWNIQMAGKTFIQTINKYLDWNIVDLKDIEMQIRMLYFGRDPYYYKI